MVRGPKKNEIVGGLPRKIHANGNDAKKHGGQIKTDYVIIRFDPLFMSRHILLPQKMDVFIQSGVHFFRQENRGD